MKKRILSILVCMATLLASAQDGVSWSVKHDKKELLKATKEDPEKNIIPVKLSELSNKSNFSISYAERNTGGGRSQWIRTIALFTASDSELYRKDAGFINIKDIQLKKMLLENKIVKVYTWAIPKDPVQAARVRIRRVHLCTIELI
ncbi:MAG: hypothetical protein JWM28_4555 [Chitinophagaceae bacterium]|nr:hypothetical protein [Chitinophagaceae bacterium]